MHLLLELDINANRNQVWKIFDNPDNLVKWQPSLTSCQHQSGEPGQVGSVSSLIYMEEGHEIHMTETITSRNEPGELTGVYETEGGTNRMTNRFIALDDNTTRWQLECLFEFTGSFKFFSSIIKKSLRKRLFNNMRRFKKLVEQGEH